MVKEFPKIRLRQFGTTVCQLIKEMRELKDSLVGVMRMEEELTLMSVRL
jgi:hypothetical protein